MLLRVAARSPGRRGSFSLRLGRVCNLGGPAAAVKQGSDNAAHASFAFVMATGIVSIAAADNGCRWLSLGLFAIACAFYPVLGVRAARNRRVTVESFAIVAATSVLAARLAFSGQRSLAFALWLAAVIAWCALCCLRPGLGARTGTRLLTVVATESLAVAALLARAGWSGLRSSGSSSASAFTWSCSRPGLRPTSESGAATCGSRWGRSRSRHWLHPTCA